MQVSGIIEEKTVNGKSIKVNGEWYGAFAAPMIGTYGPGDSVIFSVKDGKINPNTGRPYQNIQGKVNSIGATPATAASASGSYKPTVTDIGRPILNKDRLILRQNAATTAAKVYGDFLGNYMTVEELSTLKTSIGYSYMDYCDAVIELAKRIEAYTSGDADMEEAEATLGKD